MRIDWIESSTVDTYKRRNQHLLNTRARAQAQLKCGIYARYGANVCGWVRMRLLVSAHNHAQGLDPDDHLERAEDPNHAHLPHKRVEILLHIKDDECDPAAQSTRRGRTQATAALRHVVL